MGRLDRLYAWGVWRSLFRGAHMERIDRRPPEEDHVAAVRPLLLGLCRRTASYVAVPPSFPTYAGP